MNDETLPRAKSLEIEDGQVEKAQDNEPRDGAPTPNILGPEPVLENRKESGGEDNDNEDVENGKNDSEAETVVLAGKDEATAQPHGVAINYEGKSDSGVNDDQKLPTERTEASEDHIDNEASIRVKQTIQEPTSGTIADGGYSSNLSSTVSSPLQEAHSPTHSDSESSRSLSTPPNEDDSSRKESVSRKRKLRADDTDGSGRQGRNKRDTSSETANFQERHGKRRPVDRETSHDRSQSPPLRAHQRAQSTDLPGAQKRRKPPPLLVGQRRKESEDSHVESDDSGSTHGPALLRKLASSDNTAFSPAKMPPHKKLRDKNGRTWLARAAATEDVETVVARLQERPEDVDIADNAGNTPLQIAALEGHASVVQVLLDAGCDISCKNIDFDTPLIDAVENNHLDVVKLLLKAGVDPRQSNAKGEEPLDLLNPDDDSYDGIRAALMEARENTTRRHSEDHHGQPSAGRRDSVSNPSPRGSPVHSARSPPSTYQYPRRRTARSEATRNDLLWVNPTPENLRDRAGKGDMAGVDHILNMRPKADTESVLAAARGGHEVVLQLLIAIGKPEQDPEPLQSSTHKSGYNTPMLAAIGRGNVRVIQLLLEQPGFDPTRRLYRNMTYYEIAKERQGSLWQEEVDILKDAYDRYSTKASKRSQNGSPKKARVGTEGRDLKRLNKRDSSSSPLTSGKTQSPDSATKEDVGKRAQKSKEERLNSFKERRPRDTNSHLRVPEARSRDSSVVVSDHDAKRHGPPQSKLKPSRSASDAGISPENGPDFTKPRRKLVSGKVFKSGQEKKRRVSVASAASSSSQEKSKPDSGVTRVVPKIKREDSSNKPTSKQGDALKKRSRKSVSPRASASDLGDIAGIAKKKKKRRRVDSNGNAVEENSDPLTEHGPAKVATMIGPSQNSLSSNSLGPAPVAVMGTSNMSPVKESPTKNQVRATTGSPASVGDQASQQNKYLQDINAQRKVEEGVLRQQKLEQELGKQEAAKAEEQARVDEAQRREQDQLERDIKLKAREEAERQNKIALQEEEARLEEKRRVEEAERKARIERDEEDARIEKKRRDDELQRRRIEQERLRREEQERRRAEQEAREAQIRILRQEQEERRRRECLPNGLKRAAELSHEDARTQKEIMKWLPLFTVTSIQLDEQCDDESKDERWIPNFQAAAVLAVTDLDLSQCKH